MRPVLVVLLVGLLGCAKEPPPHPIVGSWQDTRWTDSVDVFQRRYTFDREGMLTIQMHRPPVSDTTFSLHYAFERDSLLTLTDAHGSEQFIARVQDDTLLLRTPEMASTFIRVRE